MLGSLALVARFRSFRSPRCWLALALVCAPQFSVSGSVLQRLVCWRHGTLCLRCALWRHGMLCLRCALWRHGTLCLRCALVGVGARYQRFGVDKHGVRHGVAGHVREAWRVQVVQARQQGKTRGTEKEEVVYCTLLSYLRSSVPISFRRLRPACHHSSAPTWAVVSYQHNPSSEQLKRVTRACATARRPCGARQDRLDRTRSGKAPGTQA